MINSLAFLLLKYLITLRPNRFFYFKINAGALDLIDLLALRKKTTNFGAIVAFLHQIIYSTFLINLLEI